MRQLIIAFAVAFAFPASAQVPAELPRADDVSLDPASAPAGVYQLDPRHASVIWRVRHTGIGIYVGRFDTCLRSTATCQQNGVTGTLDFNPQAPEATTLSMQVEIAAVSTGLVNTQGERAFDNQIAALLGAERNPTATFTSRTITPTSATTALVEGDLALNGETHPVTLEAEFQGGRNVALRGGKYVMALRGRTIIDRRQWNVGNLIFNQFAGDAVEIVVEAEFVQD